MAATRLAILLLIAVAWGAEVQGTYALAVTTTIISTIVLSSGLEVANGYYAATLGIRRALLVHSLAFGLLFGTATGIALYALFPHLPFLSGLGIEYRLLLTVSVAPMVLQFTLSGLLMGPGLFKNILQVTVAGSVAQGLLAVVVLATSSDPSLLYLGFTVGNILMSALAFAVAWRRSHGQLLDASLGRATVSYAAKAYPLNVLNWGAFRVDLLLIAWFRSTAEVGVYALASSLAEGLLYIGKSVGPPLFSLRATGQSTGVGEISPSYRLVGMLTLLAGTVTVLGFGFLVLPVLGPAYELALPVLVVLCAAMLPMAMHTMASWELAGTGRPQRSVRGAIAGLAITILLAPLAIIQFGVIGAAAVSVVAYTGASIITLRAVAPELGVISMLSSLRPRRSDLHGALGLPGLLRAAMTSGSRRAGTSARRRCGR